MRLLLIDRSVAIIRLKVSLLTTKIDLRIVIKQNDFKCGITKKRQAAEILKLR